MKKNRVFFMLWQGKGESWKYEGRYRWNFQHFKVTRTFAVQGTNNEKVSGIIIILAYNYIHDNMIRLGAGATDKANVKRNNWKVKRNWKVSWVAISSFIFFLARNSVGGERPPLEDQGWLTQFWQASSFFLSWEAGTCPNGIVKKMTQSPLSLSLTISFSLLPASKSLCLCPSSLIGRMSFTNCQVNNFCGNFVLQKIRA